MTMESKKDRRKYIQGYDPTYWTKRSLEVLEGVNSSESTTWLKHPCTQALLLALQADISGTVQAWLGGGYADADNVDSTAQMQAKARGMAQACDDIVETINLIGNNKFGDSE